MKRLIAFVLILALTVSTCLAYSVPDNTIVYVTPSGTKYHRENCSYTTTVRSMTILAAVNQGYTACSRCRPNVLTGNYESDWDGGYTDSSGGSGTSSSSSVSPTPTPSEPEEKETNKVLNAVLELIKVVGLLIAGWIGIMAVYGILYYLVVGVRFLFGWRERKEEKQRKAEEARLQKEKYTKFYSGKNILAMAGAPEKITIGSDGLPKMIDASGWGKEFTFYVSRTGQAYHRKRGCSGAHIPVHALRVSGYRACTRCCPVQPDLAWYKQYCEIKQIADMYNIPMECAPLQTVSIAQEQSERATGDYWTTVQTGTGEAGNPVCSTIYANDPEELKRKVDEATKE